ncbi:MAG TPA: hypothetical protein VGL86_04070 [Polyangia bacterium]|jgi:hypothetical protein
MWRAAAILALFGFGAAAAGCGGSNGSGTGGNSAHEGVLWISWTVNGQAVSDTSCAAVDHLTLTMQTSAGDLEIEPIPCLRGLGWEYDGLPEGFDVVILDAFNLQNENTLEGVADVTVTGDKPATPAPLALQPL